MTRQKRPPQYPKPFQDHSSPLWRFLIWLGSWVPWAFTMGERKLLEQQGRDPDRDVERQARRW